MSLNGNDLCANCDHPRSAHFEDHQTRNLINCIALGTEGDKYCTCNEFEEPAATSDQKDGRDE